MKEDKIKLTKAEIYAYREMKSALNAGAEIKATDPKRSVLEPISDMEIDGNLTFLYPEDDTHFA